MGTAHCESGGIAISRSIREEYLKHPNHCAMCNKPILPKIGEKLNSARCKIYCSRSCAASKNNQTPKRIKKVVACSRCGCAVEKSGNKLCKKCSSDRLDRITSRSKDSLTHPIIRGNARMLACKTFKMKCEVCGYDKHVEVCHRKPVSSFHGGATISEINALDNLVILCPNHHWEFDNGFLILQKG